MYRLKSAALELGRLGGAGSKARKERTIRLVLLVARVGYVHATVTRFMGLIVIAMRVQFCAIGHAIIHG